jgi:hypothetical protein
VKSVSSPVRPALAAAYQAEKCSPSSREKHYRQKLHVFFVSGKNGNKADVLSLEGEKMIETLLEQSLPSCDLRLQIESNPQSEPHADQRRSTNPSPNRHDRVRCPRRPSASASASATAPGA